jgi:hypothetical protein
METRTSSSRQPQPRHPRQSQPRRTLPSIMSRSLELNKRVPPRLNPSIEKMEDRRDPARQPPPDSPAMMSNNWLSKAPGSHLLLSDRSSHNLKSQRSLRNLKSQESLRNLESQASSHNLQAQCKTTTTQTTSNPHANTLTKSRSNGYNDWIAKVFRVSLVTIRRVWGERGSGEMNS